MNALLRLFYSLMTINLAVLATWQVQRGAVGWVIFDVMLGAIFLALLTERRRW